MRVTTYMKADKTIDFSSWILKLSADVASH